jgi:hypothetical protein
MQSHLLPKVFSSLSETFLENLDPVDVQILKEFVD